MTTDKANRISGLLKKSIVDISIGPGFTSINMTVKNAVLGNRAFNYYCTILYTIKCLSQEPPETPGKFKLVSISSRIANFSWNAPYDGKSPILRYVIQYRQKGGMTDICLCRR